MKNLTTILTAAVILYSCFCYSQNLVPNGSFEQFDTCPDNTNHITYAVNWFQPCKTSNSTDYFNACDSTIAVGVPENFTGYQQGKAGVAYVGIITYVPWPSVNYREFIEVKLDSPLIQNFTY